MLAKDYVKGKRNMHFFITRSDFRNWFHFTDPLDWRALLFWHSHVLTRSSALLGETQNS